MIITDRRALRDRTSRVISTLPTTIRASDDRAIARRHFFG
jgi:hypothetical protein